jgi:hypothetical protein
MERAVLWSTVEQVRTIAERAVLSTALLAVELMPDLAY